VSGPDTTGSGTGITSGTGPLGSSGSGSGSSAPTTG
jgi:hypothetical protein